MGEDTLTAEEIERLREKAGHSAFLPDEVIRLLDTITALTKERDRTAEICRIVRAAQKEDFARAEAAESTITAQAARIAELEAGLEELSREFLDRAEAAEAVSEYLPDAQKIASRASVSTYLECARITRTLATPQSGEHPSPGDAP